MGEIKSVKVDNWGVFFLQKLQNFFNKTDYCDLTLQFRDNSQLKVHRLVLSACTDYFNVLEQTCEVIDDALIMPNELQADVVVPIVNFMYTGTLEFELKMYGKLLRTAKEMNMTVLLKLLEAHRRTMENVNRAQRPPSPKAIRRRVPPVAGQTTAMPIYQQNQGGIQGRHVLASNVAVGGGSGNATNTVQRRIVQTKTAGTNVSPVQIQYRQQIGSTSVVRTSTLRAQSNQTTQQQQSLQAYVKNEPLEYETYDCATGQPQISSSPFEQLRKGYNNNKRPAVSTFLSPPAKKPNLEDVKEFAEQQRMRKQIAAEYGEDQEFEGMMDDDMHNDDDDDDALMSNTVQSSTLNSANINNAASTQQVQAASASNVATATITIKPESDSQPPTIIVKDHSGSKMDHAKIISEVLRQYPQLAKGNKNIKLKIMPTGQGQAQRIVIKKEGNAGEQQQASEQLQQHKQISNEPIQRTSQHVITKSGERIPQQQYQQQSQLQATAAKPNVVAVQQALVTTTSNAATATVDNTQQKRRIDSKTMHALIALGAENMTGPWLCLRCGLNGRPISIPSYRGFRRHLINTHKETIDPAICEHCGWRSQNNRELHFHVQIEHKIKTTLYTFPECLLCAELFLDTNSLNQHMLDSHPSANKQQCVYCNKIFIKDMQLYTHLKLYHKHQAIEDGIIDVSEEEYTGSQQGDNAEMEEHLDSEQQQQHEEEEQQHNKDKKVKILSDISLPMASSIIKLDGNTLTADSNVIDAQTKFVTADGNEMLLTDEQRKEIMSQLNQDHNNGGVVMVLNDTIFAAGGGGDATIEDVNTNETAAANVEETVAASMNEHQTSGQEEEFDDSQIYAELASEKSEKDKQQEADERKEADESLKWAENLISEHDLTENENESGTAKKNEEDKAKKEFISKKLKELTVDWSEDENEEDDEDLEKSGQTEDSETKKEIGENVEEKISKELEGEKIDIEKTEQIDSLGDDCMEKKEDTHHLEKEKQNEDTEMKEAEPEPEEDMDDNDELDLAMQNLHEEGVAPPQAEHINTKTTVTNNEKETKEAAEKEEIVEKIESKSVVDDDKSSELAAENPESSLSSALLDELMSATATEQSADSTELASALNEASTRSVANVEVKPEEDMDDFAKANLGDVEEFPSVESSDEPTKEQESAATFSTAAEDTTNVNVAAKKNTKDEEEELNAKVDDDTDTTTQASTRIAKVITSSEWEDMGGEEVDDVKEH